VTVLPGAPAWVQGFLDRLVEAVEDDERIVGVTAGGSAAAGTMDGYSDLDLVLVCRPEYQGELLHDLPAVAGRLGRLLACFTGEHVGEPRLLIALYGPPLVHVDLKLIAEPDLDTRVEDGIVVWEARGGGQRRDAARPGGVATDGPAVDRGPVLGLGTLRSQQGRTRRTVRVPGRTRAAAPSRVRPAVGNSAPAMAAGSTAVGAVRAAVRTRGASHDRRPHRPGDA
jgi:predicted nucleotidyltransferase